LQRCPRGILEAIDVIQGPLQAVCAQLMRN
jgi:hypothetical protein